MRTTVAELEVSSLVRRGASLPLPRWLDRPWVALAVRVLGVFGLMAALATIGAISILSGVDQGKVLDDAATTKADLAAGWLAVKEAATKNPPQVRPALPSASSAKPTEGRAAQTPLSPGITADGLVVLNRATAEELTRLPGVGEKRAAAIIALRQRLGRFKRSNDLLRVRGIGPVSLQKMKPYFVLDAPEDEAKRGSKKTSRTDK